MKKALSRGMIIILFLAGLPLIILYATDTHDYNLALPSLELEELFIDEQSAPTVTIKPIESNDVQQTAIEQPYLVKNETEYYWW